MPIVVVGGCLEQLEEKFILWVPLSEPSPRPPGTNAANLEVPLCFYPATHLSPLVPTFPPTTAGTLEAWSRVTTSRGMSGDSSTSSTIA